MNDNNAKVLVEGALGRLESALRVGKSDALKTYLVAMSRFHKYSFGNILLIASQRSDASNVAGYGTWRRLGRHVRRGEKGIAILAPITLRAGPRPKEDTKAGADQEKIKRSTAVAGFRTAHVFDAPSMPFEIVFTVPTLPVTGGRMADTGRRS